MPVNLPPTTLDDLRRMSFEKAIQIRKAELDREEKRRKWLLAEAASWGEQGFLVMGRKIDELVKKVSAQITLRSSHGSNVHSVTARGASLAVGWEPPDNHPASRQRWLRVSLQDTSGESSRKLNVLGYSPDLNADGEPIWRGDDGDFSSEALGEHLLRMMVPHITGTQG